MSRESLIREYEFFKEKESELLEKYRGRFVVIKGQKVLGDFEDERTAICETRKEHESGTFFVKQCVPEEAQIPHVFHSRVAVV